MRQDGAGVGDVGLFDPAGELEIGRGLRGEAVVQAGLADEIVPVVSLVDLPQSVADFDGSARLAGDIPEDASQESGAPCCRTGYFPDNRY